MSADRTPEEPRTTEPRRPPAGIMAMCACMKALLLRRRAVDRLLPWAPSSATCRDIVKTYNPYINTEVISWSMGKALECWLGTMNATAQEGSCQELASQMRIHPICTA